MSSRLTNNTLVAHIKTRHSKRKIIVIVCAPECALVRANRTSDLKALQLFEEAIYRCCSNFGGLIRSNIKECITVSNENNRNQCKLMEVLMFFFLKYESMDQKQKIQVTQVIQFNIGSKGIQLLVLTSILGLGSINFFSQLLLHLCKLWRF